MHRRLRCLPEGSRDNVLDFVQPQRRALILAPQLNRTQRLAALPAIPDLRPLSG